VKLKILYKREKMNTKPIKLQMKYLIIIGILIGTLTSSLIAESISVTGTINAIVGDKYNPITKKMVATQIDYYIKTKDDKFYSLDINETSGVLLEKYINEKVNVEIDSDTKLYKKDGFSKKYKLLNIALSKNKTLNKKPPKNRYKKPWINLLCKFADRPRENITPKEIQKIFSNKYGYLEHYWRETTYGHIDINGTQTIDHWVTLVHNHDYYMNKDLVLAQRLENMHKDCVDASSSLYDKTLYAGYNMFFNDQVDGDIAYGQIGAFYTWIPNIHRSNLGLIAHEMGHGFGLRHSTTKDSGGDDYVSVWDVMSNFHNGDKIDIYSEIPQHTIAYNKQKLGAINSKYIFNYNQSDDSVTTDIHINRLETLPENNNSYLIAHIFSADKSKHYTIEVRDNTLQEYDKCLPDKGVIIHEIIDNRHRAYVIKKDYNGNGSNEGKHWVSGETFLDTNNNIQIDVLKEVGTGYNVHIHPTIDILPPSDLQLNIVAKNSIDIIWKDNSNNEDGFNIYYDDKLVATLDTNTTKYTYTDDSPFSGDIHTIKVKAYNSSVESYPLIKIFSSNVAFITSPKNADKVLNNHSVTINWDNNNINNISLTIAYRLNGKETIFTKISNPEGKNYTYTTPEEFDEIIFSLASYDTDNKQIDTSIVHLYSYSTIPNKPTDFNTTLVTVNKTNLSWKDNSDNESGFKIYNIENELVKTVDVNITSTTLDNLTRNTTYIFKIKAYNLRGESNASLVKFTTLDTNNSFPNKPTNFKEINVTQTTATLTWDQNSDDIDGYKIYYEGHLLPITLDKNSTSYTLSNLVENREYTYSLRAYNNAGESNVTEVTFKTLDINISKSIIMSPKNGDTVKAGDSLTVTWKNSGAQKVFLYIPGIYFGFVEDTSKTLKIPVKKKGKLFITLFSEINNKWEYDRITIKVKRDVLTLPAPTNLVASNITKHSVKLTWNDNAKNETGYKIKCRRVRRIELPENSESYTVRRLKANTQYRCKVRAFNGKVKSKPAIISFKTVDNTTSKSTIISPKNGDIVKAGEMLTITWKNRGGKKVYLSVPSIYSGFVKGTSKILKVPAKKKGKVFVTLYSKINHKWKSDKVMITIE